jgi:YaaC-like Protein
MAVDRTLLRAALRRRRTSLVSRTLLASSSSRRGAFSAAMQQFEELMSASAAVGPSSRPITLYYAIVQAGLAVAAAHKTNPWSFSQHGLKLQNPRAPIADVSVGPEGAGAFQIVAEATHSPPLEMPVTVGALWSSLPDFEFTKLPATSAPIALGIYADAEPDGPSVATVIVEDQSPGPEDFKQHLSDRLSAYPGIDGFTVVEGSYAEAREGRWNAQLRWDHKIDLDEIAPAYLHPGS